MNCLRVIDNVYVQAIDPIQQNIFRIPFHLPNLVIDKQFLDTHLSCRFVFDSSFIKSRPVEVVDIISSHSNSIEFNMNFDFNETDEISSFLDIEKCKLEEFIIQNSHLYFLISKLGSLINYSIFLKFFEPWLLSFNKYKNVSLLF